MYKLVPGLLEDQLKKEREYCQKQNVDFTDSGSHLLKFEKVQYILKEDEEAGRSKNEEELKEQEEQRNLLENEEREKQSGLIEDEEREDKKNLTAEEELIENKTEEQKEVEEESRKVCFCSIYHYVEPM